MKKFNFDKRYVKVSLYALAVVVLSIVSYRVIHNFTSIVASVNNFFDMASSVLATFVYGFFIAFFANAPVRFLENKAFGRIKYLKKARRARRALSVGTVLVVAVGLFYWMLTFLFPELVSSFRSLVDALRLAVDTIYRLGFTELNDNEMFAGVIGAFNDLFYTEYTVRDLTQQALTPVLGMLNSVPAFMTQIYLNILLTAKGVLNFIIGIIIAAYMLYEKENLARGLTRFIYAFIPKNPADSFIAFCKRANHILERFTLGKILDSAIMGVLFFICAFFMKLPFPLLLTIIFAVSNVIPYFGPIVGGVIISIIVMFENPALGLWTGVICLILQQIDGNIIGPKILGDSTGLKPLGVIFAILVGGALFGVPGMFFGTPVFAIIVSLFRAYVNKRNAKRDTEQYIMDVAGEPEEEADVEDA